MLRARGVVLKRPWVRCPPPSGLLRGAERTRHMESRELVATTFASMAERGLLQLPEVSSAGDVGSRSPHRDHSCHPERLNERANEALSIVGLDEEGFFVLSAVSANDGTLIHAPRGFEFREVLDAGAVA